MYICLCSSLLPQQKEWCEDKSNGIDHIAVSGKQICLRHPHPKGDTGTLPQCVAISPYFGEKNDQYCVTGGRDYLIYKWKITETNDWKMVGDSWKGHDDTVTAIVFSPCGKYCLSGGNDKVHP
jgi:WD40 repeat protein